MLRHMCNRKIKNEYNPFTSSPNYRRDARQELFVISLYFDCVKGISFGGRLYIKKGNNFKSIPSFFISILKEISAP